VVLYATAAESTSSTLAPPTTVPLALAPGSSVCVPPFSTIVASALPAEDTVSKPPLSMVPVVLPWLDTKIWAPRSITLPPATPP